MSRKPAQSFDLATRLWTQPDVDPFQSLVLEGDRLWVFGAQKIQQLNIEDGACTLEKQSPGDTWKHDVTVTAEHLIIPVGDCGIYRVKKDFSQAVECIWPASGACDAVAHGGFAYCTRWQDPDRGSRMPETRSEHSRREKLRPGETEARSGHTVAKLDLSSLEAVWEAEAGSVGCRATIAGGRVYVGSAAGGVHVFNDEDGKLRWHEKNPPGRISCQGEAIAEGSLLYLNADRRKHAVCAVKLNEPGVAWSGDVDAQPMSYALHHGGKVFCGTESRLYAFDGSDGGATWELGDLAGIPWMTRIRVWQGCLYLGAGNSVIFVDVETGECKGSVECPVQNEGDRVRISLIEDGKLYAATGNDDEGSLQVTAFSLA